MSEKPSLFDQAKAVLQQNDRGQYTAPADHYYPHQWLWDSCFTAIGQRHYDVERAKTEILSLLRGQWSNGMIPHTIFARDFKYKQDHNSWRSWVSPYSPHDVYTSGITQPPLLAEAIWQIGQVMQWPERRSWYRLVMPHVLAYHEWLYRERDPHQEGLTLQIHPWETGLDTTPPWMSELHEHLLPGWIRAIQTLRLDPLLGIFRRDNQGAFFNPRYSNIDALAMYDAHRRLMRKAYDIDKILDHSLFAIEDLAFNAILIRNNELLLDMARSIKLEVPEDLQKSIKRTTKALEELWDPYAEQYFPRDFITHKLIKEPSIATLLPLYAGSISQERAEILVRSIENDHIFGPAYPLPSVPLNSPWFNAKQYWQGPTWFNINWMIADGLRRYGFKHHAEALIESSLELAEKHGFSEYFDPLSGDPLGAPSFSWTAAVVIDWLKKPEKKK